MSQEVPNPPYPPQISQELNYESPALTGNAQLLIKLATIFNLTMAGLDMVYGLILIGMAFFMQWAIVHAPPPPHARAGGAPPPPWLFLVMYIPMGLLSFSAGTVKLIAGIKLLKTNRHAWGWALAAGICGCCQLWCSIMCVLPMAVAIYTIIILCNPQVKTFLEKPRLLGSLS